ncbi:hypothetical protein BVIET440_100019 [Burkholderia vietnamiensis]
MRAMTHWHGVTIRAMPIVTHRAAR